MLGIKYDFSTCLRSGPLSYRNTVFYPFPKILCPPDGLEFNLETFMSCIKLMANKGIAILLLHPSTLVNRDNWDSIFFHEHPKELTLTKSRFSEEQKRLLRGFSFFAKRLSKLEKTGLIEVTPRLAGSKMKLNPTPSLVDELYFYGTRWSVENFNYRPRFLYSH